jgi:tetratricopeptide (TPR) repeat protein
MKWLSRACATRFAAAVGAEHPRVEAPAEMPKHDAAAKGPLEEAERLSGRVVELEQAGRYDEAIPLARRALALRESALGPEHPDVATSLNKLAGLLQAKVDNAAEPLLRRALAIREKALGPEHPYVAQSLNNLAALHWSGSAPTQALPLLQRASAAHERALASVLAASSDRQKHTFAWTVQGETERTVSLHVRALPDRADAARLALTVLLQRKGRVLDAMTDMLAQLRARGRPEDQAKLAQLASLRGELATRTLRGPAPGEDLSHHSDTLAKLRADAEELERDLAEQYKALAVRRRDGARPAQPER